MDAGERLQRLIRRLRAWVGSGDSDDDAAEKTTIEDAEATSLRAIKLPDEERDALDVEEREP